MHHRPPPYVRDGDWAFDKNGFSRRGPDGRWYLRFSRLLILQTFAQNKLEEIEVAWCVAQMHHYGLSRVPAECPGNTPAQILQSFASLITNLIPPTGVLRIEQQLRVRWESTLKAHQIMAEQRKAQQQEMQQRVKKEKSSPEYQEEQLQPRAGEDQANLQRSQHSMIAENNKAFQYEYEQQRQVSVEEKKIDQVEQHRQWMLEKNKTDQPQRNPQQMIAEYNKAVHRGQQRQMSLEGRKVDQIKEHRQLMAEENKADHSRKYIQPQKIFPDNRATQIGEKRQLAKEDDANQIGKQSRMKLAKNTASQTGNQQQMTVEEKKPEQKAKQPQKMVEENKDSQETKQPQETAEETGADQEGNRLQTKVEENRASQEMKQPQEMAAGTGASQEGHRLRTTVGENGANHKIRQPPQDPASIERAQRRAEKRAANLQRAIDKCRERLEPILDGPMISGEEMYVPPEFQWAATKKARSDWAVMDEKTRNEFWAEFAVFVPAFIRFFPSFKAGGALIVPGLTVGEHKILE